MPRKAGGAGKSQEEMLQDIAKNILEKLPPNFDVDEASKKHPIMYNESMNTVLQQELLRFNKLLSVMKSTLINLDKAIQGTVVMSMELEMMFNDFLNNKVPLQWVKAGYPSLKPLSSWVPDLLLRLEFISSWLYHGPPKTYWLPSFFFP
jgi:dynein heavy chain